MKKLIANLYWRMNFWWTWNFPNRRMPVLWRVLKPIHSWIVRVAAIVFLFSVVSVAQTSCPVDMVCISPAAARQALQDSDMVKAQAAGLAVKDQAIADLKNLAESLKVDIAKLTGEKTQLESAAVRYTAIIDALLRSFKKSHKFGIVNIN